MWFLALFLALPIIEIALFIQVGGLIGLWPTLFLVILGSILGVAIIRHQGATAGIRLQRSLNELRDPARPLAHGVLIVLAGMLLILPGFFTDTLGLLLLIPMVRDAVLARMSARVRRARDPHRPPYADGVIDGDYVVQDDQPPQPKPQEIISNAAQNHRPSGWSQH
ncbi:FxsA family protein [Paracoccus sp. (in: a-proteobacteria)]|uniref:FxsA family protein n=1 Tax=Paracoccus sp. TaxID=267 RepID=UPI0026DFBB1E|nr:FxsA family protein [Paracoccus sp. (in: a-proteobacteria)]MDO5648344.1 FxsA family protein [Paracoccus sp. (in: a-proteobacteria)]